jgi:hypothetical protein
MEALNSPETSVLTRATRRNIPEDGILRPIYELFYIYEIHEIRWSYWQESQRERDHQEDRDVDG